MEGIVRRSNRNQSTCLMHRRTSVFQTHSEFSSSAKAAQSPTGKRWLSFVWATPPARIGRYTLELFCGATRIRTLSLPARIMNNQSGRCEHQAAQFRRNKRGIAPDVVRPELETPLSPRSRAARQFRSEIAGVYFLRHFSLVQPYF